MRLLQKKRVYLSEIYDGLASMHTYFTTGGDVMMRQERTPPAGA